MATTSTVPWYSNHERGGGTSSAAPSPATVLHRQSQEQQQQQQQQQQGVASSRSSPPTTSPLSAPAAIATCPPSNFPDKFQDFFATLNEDVDDLPSMLEDKLIPRKQDDSRLDALGNNNNNVVNKQRWPKRAFQRRSSEIEVRLHSSSRSEGHGVGPRSPNPSRRRSSSIAVARPTPDLHRFLQAEAGPWGHLSPSPRSPTRTPSLSPSAMSTTSQHLSSGASPCGPSPTSPAAPNPVVGGTGSRLPPQSKHRGRTSSMPAVPRHKSGPCCCTRGYDCNSKEAE